MQFLKRLPKTTLVNTVYKLEQLAKSKGLNQQEEQLEKQEEKLEKQEEKLEENTKGQKQLELDLVEDTNRQYQEEELAGNLKNNTKTRKSRKPRRLVKGTPEAKRYMAKIRRMRA